jgi:hypothetical protein
MFYASVFEFAGVFDPTQRYIERTTAKCFRHHSRAIHQVTLRLIVGQIFVQPVFGLSARTFHRKHLRVCYSYSKGTATFYRIHSADSWHTWFAARLTMR